jgi:hypothetical protein
MPLGIGVDIERIWYRVLSLCCGLLFVQTQVQVESLLGRGPLSYLDESKRKPNCFYSHEIQLAVRFTIKFLFDFLSATRANPLLTAHNEHKHNFLIQVNKRKSGKSPRLSTR